MVVTLPSGRTTSGAGDAGFAIVGAGSVRSVVSGRTDPDLAAARTLSAAIGDEAARAVTSRASNIEAVGSRGERLYAERGPLFHTDPSGVTIEHGAGLDGLLRPQFSPMGAPKSSPNTRLPHHSPSVPNRATTRKAAQSGSRVVRILQAGARQRAFRHTFGRTPDGVRLTYPGRTARRQGSTSP